MFEYRLGSQVALQVRQLRIVRRGHLQAPGDLGDKFEQLGDLVLGEQADLQVQLGALLGEVGHAVLARQHKGREKIASTEATVPSR